MASVGDDGKDKHGDSKEGSDDTAYAISVASSIGRDRYFFGVSKYSAKHQLNQL